MQPNVNEIRRKPGQMPANTAGTPDRAAAQALGKFVGLSIADVKEVQAQHAAHASSVKPLKQTATVQVKQAPPVQGKQALPSQTKQGASVPVKQTASVQAKQDASVPPRQEPPARLNAVTRATMIIVPIALICAAASIWGTNLLKSPLADVSTPASAAVTDSDGETPAVEKAKLVADDGEAPRPGSANSAEEVKPASDANDSGTK